MMKSHYTFLPPRNNRTKPAHVVVSSKTAPATEPVLTSDDLSFGDSPAAYNDIFRGPTTTAASKRYPHENEKKEHNMRFSLPSVNFFRRKKKLASIDVASVGNASDTMVSFSSNARFSGRELHENAKMYFNQGDYKRALPLFEAILSAQVRRFSPLHASVGAAMHNVGVCRFRLGQHPVAENIFSEAVQIRRQTLGQNHLEVSASLSKLGATRMSLGKLDQALTNLLEALRIARTNLGYEHTTVAQILGHVGCFYFEVDELYAAQATFQEALDIYRAIWPRERDRDACMAQLTDTLCNIGSIQNRRKKFADAVDSFSEALDLQLGILDHDDPRVIATLDNLGYSYSKQRDYASALNCYRKLMRAQISRAETFTDECFESFRKQLLMYERLKRIPDAINEANHVLQLQKSMLHANHPLIYKTKDIVKNMTRDAQFS